MRMKFELGTLLGLRLTADTTAIVGFALVWALAFIFAIAALGLSPVEALVGGLICAAIHFLLELIHQLGHAAAAWSTSYPMTGVHFWLALGMSKYPREEGDPPARVHIRRALGGPVVSAIVCLLLGLAALGAQPLNQTPGWIVAFAFLDSLLVFTIGALLPLGFTDGSTLLRWWGRDE